VPTCCVDCSIHLVDENVSLCQPFFAVGNVGCLAVDSLLATHSSSLIHVGYLDAFRMRVQVALGNDALACDQSEVCGRLHLPLEVFYDKQSSLVVVQQRAPVIKVHLNFF
jgi:predicted ATP-grasp superfamily ATP-dependent carboligase